MNLGYTVTLNRFSTVIDAYIGLESKKDVLIPKLLHASILETPNGYIELYTDDDVQYTKVCINAHEG